MILCLRQPDDVLDLSHLKSDALAHREGGMRHRRRSGLTQRSLFIDFQQPQLIGGRGGYKISARIAPRLLLSL